MPTRKLWSFAKSRLGINILGTAFARIGTVAISLYSVRLALTILPASEYGVWLTLASILAWIHLFDIGLGNGLRNHLTATLTKGDYEGARQLISCAYLGLGLIAASIALAYMIAAPYLNWPKILNSESVSSATLVTLANIVAISMTSQFFLKIIFTILHADQKAWVATGLEFFGSALTLAGLLIIQHMGKADLLTFGLVLSATPVVSLLAISFALFFGKYRHLRPSIHKVNLTKLINISNLGLKFFVIQIAVLVLFQATNLLIARLYAPVAVAEFQIAARYYSILVLGWSFVMAPLWSAFTEAIEQGNDTWARKTISNLYRLFALSGALAVLLFFCSESLIAAWTDKKISVSPLLNFSVVAYTLVLIWNNIHAYYLNGASELKLQIKTSLAAVLLFPVSVILLKTLADLGPSTVVISVTISLSLFAVLAPREVARHLATIKPHARS